VGTTPIFVLNDPHLQNRAFGARTKAHLTGGMNQA